MLVTAGSSYHPKSQRVKKGSVPEPRSTGGHSRDSGSAMRGGTSEGHSATDAGATSTVLALSCSLQSTKPLLPWSRWDQTQILSKWVFDWRSGLQWIYFFLSFSADCPYPLVTVPFFFPLGNLPPVCTWLGCRSHVTPNSPIPGGDGTGDKLCNLGRDAEGHVVGGTEALMALPYRSSVWVFSWHPCSCSDSRFFQDFVVHPPSFFYYYCKRFPVSLL